MKLLASIQIVVLLGTTVLPDGPLSLKGAGCECSALERTTSNCCSSGRAFDTAREDDKPRDRYGRNP